MNYSLLYEIRSQACNVKIDCPVEIIKCDLFLRSYLNHIGIYSGNIKFLHFF